MERFENLVNPVHYVLLIVLFLLGLYVARRLLFRLAFAAVRLLPEYQARMRHLERSQRAEQTVIEQADWFGTTGLSEDLERELPKYLRRECGELLLDEGSLKAGDLTYLGSFAEPDGTLHYWTVPSSDGEPTCAYIGISNGESCMGWGGRRPPHTGNQNA